MKPKILFQSAIILTLALAGCSFQQVASPTEVPVLATQNAVPAALASPSAEAPSPAASPTTSQPRNALTVTPPPSPTPIPVLRSLTRGGCCVQPFWSPDSQQVLFIDRPSPDSPAGLWAADMGGGTPVFFSDKLGLYSSDMSLRAYPQNGRTIVERLSDGAKWIIPNGGRPVSFSPDGSLLAWTAGESGPPDDTARREIWISQVDGTQPLRVREKTGGSFAAWFPDGRILVSERTPAPESQQVLYALSIQGEDAGNLVELARGQRLRGSALSPGGTWLVYLVTFSEDPAQDGLWLVNTLSGERRHLEIFGSFRWRDDHRLLLVPMDLTQPTHRLLQIEATSGEITPLTDPTITPFKVSNGDWSISPDGQHVIFVSAQDQNIWLLSLPEGS